MHHESQLFSKQFDRRTSRVAYLQAVVTVFEGLDEAGKQPRASVWNNAAYLERHAMTAVREEWARRTELDEALFPWSLTEVTMVWEEWRKMNSEYGEQYCKDLGFLDLAAKYRQKAKEKVEKQQTKQATS